MKECFCLHEFTIILLTGIFLVKVTYTSGSQLIGIYTVFSTAYESMMKLGSMRENLNVAREKGTDQPEHVHSLINTFVIHYLESKNSLLHTRFQYIRIYYEFSEIRPRCFG